MLKQQIHIPNGYIAIANELGITSGVAFHNYDVATRGNIALFIRKSLDVPYYIIYSDGEQIIREKSEQTLYEFHIAPSFEDDLS